MSEEYQDGDLEKFTGIMPDMLYLDENETVKAPGSASTPSSGEAPKRAHQLEWAVHLGGRCCVVPVEDISKLLGGSSDETRDRERYARVIVEARHHEFSGYKHKLTRAEAESVAAQIVADHNTRASADIEAKLRAAKLKSLSEAESERRNRKAIKGEVKLMDEKPKDYESIPKAEREVRKSLGILIASVRLFETQIDAAYANRSMPDVERGKLIAKHMNDLIGQNDRCLYFGLGFDFRRDAVTKRHRGTNINPIMTWARKTTREKR